MGTFRGQLEAAAAIGESLESKALAGRPRVQAALVAELAECILTSEMVRLAQELRRDPGRATADGRAGAVAALARLLASALPSGG